MALLDFARSRERTPSPRRFKVASPGKHTNLPSPTKPSTKLSLLNSTPSRLKVNNNKLSASTLNVDDGLINFHPNKKIGAPFSFKWVPDVEEIEDPVTQRKRRRSSEKQKSPGRKKIKRSPSSDSFSFSSLSTPSPQTLEGFRVDATQLTGGYETPMTMTEGSVRPSFLFGVIPTQSQYRSSRDSESYYSFSEIYQPKHRRPPRDSEGNNNSFSATCDTEDLLTRILKEPEASESITPETQTIDTEKLNSLSDSEKNRLIVTLFEENNYCRRRITDLTYYLQSTHLKKFKVRS